MAKIKKIQESGETIYPATIFQAIKNPKNGQTLEKSFESEHKKLTAGFAYEILGDGQATAEKFSFRPTGRPNRNVRDGSARIEVLKGNSVVWNQLVTNGTFTGGVDGTVPSGWVEGSYYMTTRADISYPQDGGILFTTIEGKSGNGIIKLQTFTQINAGEKLYVAFDYQSDFQFAVGDDTGNVVRIHLPASTQKTSYRVIKEFTTAPTKWGIQLLTFWTGGQKLWVNNMCVINLTRMFGAGNEPTTVEQFYELLPEGVDINAYNEGEIVDANYKAIKTTGFNQWDEQWEVGYLNSDGSSSGYVQNYIRAKNYIPVIGGAKYFAKLPIGVSDSQLYAVDKDYKLIKQITPWGNKEFTIPSNASYIRFYTKYRGEVYNNDICLSLYWPTEYGNLYGTYKPYKPFERDLSWVAKYFPNGMRSAGNVADEIRFNSTTQQWEAVQRVGVVDLGSLSWEYKTRDNGAMYFMSAVVSAMYKPTAYMEMSTKTLCAKYVFESFIELYNNTATNKCFSIDISSTRVYIHDPAYTDADTFKAAMQDVMLNYELATPIVTPITEDVNLAYDVADYGTEQLIVADGAQSAPLSADVVYEPNVLASIKQVAAMLTRLDALETAVATMQASAVATTNEE